MNKAHLFTSFLILVFLAITLISPSANGAERPDWLDPKVPESWFEAPKAASDWNIQKFSQAPEWDALVAEGKLPPVEERLPDDPPVIEPYEKVGTYGGQIDCWQGHSGMESWDGTGCNIMSNGPHFVRFTADGRKWVPDVVKDWEWSKDAKQVTFTLHKDHKWSDGHPFTTDDFMYWWEHVAQNEDLNPIPPEKWSPSLLDVTVEGKHKVTFHFAEAARSRVQFYTNTQWALRDPKHYCKQFHPDFVDKEILMKEAKERGFGTWAEYYEVMAGNNATMFPNRSDGLDRLEWEDKPSLRPYVTTKRSSTYLVAEANPYFHFVDTEGNQLPYIRRLRLNQAESIKMQHVKQSIGEADTAGRQVRLRDITLYQKNAEEYGFVVDMWIRGGRGPTLGFNLSHQDPRMRSILGDARFRKAVSVALDRDEINQKLYFGQGTPNQYTVMPSSMLYEERFAQAYIERNLEQAKKWLDEMGLKDVNNDGLREGPDGKPFQPVLIYPNWLVPVEITEIIQSNLNDVGIDLMPKLVKSSLYFARIQANNFDMEFIYPEKYLLDPTFCMTLGRHLAPGPTGAGINSGWTSWPAWGNWYATDGERGMEPPEEMKKLAEIRMKIQAKAERDEEWIELGKQLLQAQAENLWTVATVGLAPKPVIKNAKMRNTVKKAIWADDLDRSHPYYPEQWYYEE